jgi:hypothetical protein
MKTLQYRWSVNTPNVYSFLMFKYAGTIASYKNEVSGWISKSQVNELMKALNESGNTYTNLKLVTSKRYWNNYDKYNTF